MNSIQSAVNSAANQADVLLEGVNSPAEAKPILREWVAENYSALSGPEQSEIVAKVLAVLVEEEFFSAAAGADSSEDSTDAMEADE